jgi:hypothetical protein
MIGHRVWESTVCPDCGRRCSLLVDGTIECHMRPDGRHECRLDAKNAPPRHREVTERGVRPVP